MPLLALIVWAVGTAASPAAPPSPAPGLKADLARHFFASPEAEREGRGHLTATLDGLDRFRGRIGSSAGTLLAGLRTLEGALRIERRHLAYLRLRCAGDRTDKANCSDEDEIHSQTSARTAFVAAEVGRIPQANILLFMRDEPGLQAYGFAIDQARRTSSHALDLPREELLDRLQPSLTGWQFPLYEEILGRIRFGTISTPAGELDARRDRTRIATHPDRGVREKGFRLLWEGFASQRDLLSFTLLQTARAQNELARLHGFADAPARQDFEMSLEAGQTRRFLDRVAEHGELLKRYERIRSADVLPSLDGSAAAAWDLSVPPSGIPPVSLDEARGLLHQALFGLGETYSKEFDDLLDPSSGRADIVSGGRAPRALGGFSVGFSGTTGVLFVGSFGGTFKDVSVVAHEGGHAAHRNLMNLEGVRPLYASGPSFLFESFAMFNELVLADWMAAHAPNPALARYYAEQFLAIKGLDFLYAAGDAALEQGVCDGVANGTLRGPDDLDRLTVKIESAYSHWPAVHKELRTKWAATTLAYEDPLYNVNYLYAGLLALKYFDLYQARREWFVPRYSLLLRKGFGAVPADLLKRSLDIDLDGPALLDDAVRVLDRRLRELEGP